MRKKSIVLLLIPFFVIFSVGLQSSDFLSVQSYIATDVNNVLTTAASWSKPIVISDDYTRWNTGVSGYPNIAIDGDGNLHIVWVDNTTGTCETDTEIMYANYTTAGWSNATVISDDASEWNDDLSFYPSIAIDGDANVHVVWQDDTNGTWGTDQEIMYAKYTAAGWSNPRVISDDAFGWNDGLSALPEIAIDNDGNRHIVWEDWTVGEWGTDIEIMYANYTAAGWSNATVISDDATGWNNDWSGSPDIAIDGVGDLYVAWYDATDGEWGSDTEIMCAKRTVVGWSNATVISDDTTGWNDDLSNDPDIEIDNDGNVHVVWSDETDGEWGTDREIMYANFTIYGWSNATVVSDDAKGWNDDLSFLPCIATDNDGSVHVVWTDGTVGEWGGGMTDLEIMYVSRTGAGWSNATVISDDATGWNNDSSLKPDIAIDGDENPHVVWGDSTDGKWGTDSEIMYIKKSAPGDRGEQINLIFVPVSDSSTSIFSTLGLGIIGIAVVAAVIITIVIMKKIK